MTRDYRQRSLSVLAVGNTQEVLELLLMDRLGLCGAFEFFHLDLSERRVTFA